MRRKVLNPDAPAVHFCNDLDRAIRDRFGYKRQCIYALPGGIVEGRTAKFDLYLRFPDEENVRFKSAEVVVIARIGFTEQQKGHGTWLLGQLVTLAHDYGYGYIGIESARAHQSIRGFIRKFGFAPLGEAAVDWIAPVIDLEELMTNVSHPQ